MNIAEFQDRLDACGVDLSVWPEDQRRAAERLLAADPAAQACLSAARRLEGLLARAATLDAPANQRSAARALSALRAPLPRQRRFASSWAWPAALLDVDLAPARLRIAALAGVAALGVVIGLFGPDIGEAGLGGAAAPPETTIAAVFEPEPLTGVRP
jgi:hypothetical protein